MLLLTYYPFENYAEWAPIFHDYLLISTFSFVRLHFLSLQLRTSSHCCFFIFRFLTTLRRPVRALCFLSVSLYSSIRVSIFVCLVVRLGPLLSVVTSFILIAAILVSFRTFLHYLLSFILRTCRCLTKFLSLSGHCPSSCAVGFHQWVPRRWPLVSMPGQIWRFDYHFIRRLQR